MNIVFYDFETTGVDVDFDQIIQVGAILINEKFEEQDRIDLRCRLNPGVVPSAAALLVNKTPILSLLEEKLSHYQMIEKLRNKFQEWSPAVFIGWNNIHFDEVMLRQALCKNLRELYITNTKGNRRSDALLIARAAEAFSPNSIKIPKNDKGKPTFKLDLIAPENGIKDFEAHTAIGDVQATIGMARLLKKNAPFVWEKARISREPDKIQEIFEEEIFYCAIFPWWREVFAVTHAGVNENNEKEIALFDLRYDPEEFFKYSLDDIYEELLKKDLPKKNAKIKTIKINHFPIFMEGKHANGQEEYAKIGIDVLEKRAEKIRQNKNFQKKVGKALTKRDKKKRKGYPRVYPEQLLYDKFPSNPDKICMSKFHNADWDDKLAFASNMEDEKLARYGKRIIFYESPDSLSDKDRSEVEKDIWKYTIETRWVSRCRGDDIKQEFYKVANKADDDGDQDALEKLEALELLWEDIAKKCKGLS